MLPCLSILGLSGDQVPGKGLLWLCAPSAAPRRWPDIRPQAYYMRTQEMDVRSMSQAEREDSVNEIRLMASVDHPNVIAYNEAFLDGNKL
eukprot:scaffold103865_cov19-Tisochrysis_lutea.AAC.1